MSAYEKFIAEVSDDLRAENERLVDKNKDYETVLRQIANNATFPAVKAGKVLEKYDE